MTTRTVQGKTYDYKICNLKLMTKRTVHGKTNDLDKN